MSLKRLAEAMEGIADEAESKELDQVLSDFGGDDGEAAPAAEAEETEEDKDEAIVARLASATDDFEISGINSGDQDEFSQVQTVGLGKEDKADYGTVAEAAKKYAFCARKLASLEVEAKKDPNGKKYLSAIASMTRILERRAAALKVAVADKTSFSGDLGHDGTRDEAEYGAYDTSKPAMDAEIQSTSAPWKTDKHDGLGLGIPKPEGEVTREASSKIAANQSIRLAVCLLGSKAPEDMIQAQAGEFFAQMKLASIERALKRIAETEALYASETTAVNPEVVPAGPVTTVEEAAKEISASAEAPVCEKKDEVKEAAAELPSPEEKKEDEFTDDEKKEIDVMTASIVARQAKMREAALAKAKALIAAEIPVVEEPVVEAPVEAAPAVVTEEKPVEAAVEAAPVVQDEIAEAVAPVEPEVAPAEELPAQDDEIDFSTSTSEDAEGIPELEACIDVPKPEVKPVVASKTAEAKPKFAQTLGGTPRLASTKKGGDVILENLWVKPGEEFFG